jgi:phospholipid/cholesterol/gamma-HCH transport system substrate-binding protein
MIGSFVLVFVAAIFFTVLWMAKIQIDKETSFYDIYFEGTVFGLGEGGDVRYQGIKVGTVENIAINPDDPGRVRVTAEVDSAIPIRVGDEASLELQGITGVSFLNIAGAGPGSELLVAGAGEPRPVIPSKPSAIEKLFQGAPNLIAQGILVTERVEAMLSQENVQRLSAILSNLESVTGELAARRHRIGGMLDTFDQASQELAAAASSARSSAAGLDLLMIDARETVAGARRVVQRAEGIVENDVPALVADFRQVATSLDAMAGQAEGMLAENREPLKAFTEQGLLELNNFVSEGRILIARMARMLERIENEGAGFLLGTKDEELELK